MMSSAACADYLYRYFLMNTLLVITVLVFLVISKANTSESSRDAPFYLSFNGSNVAHHYRATANEIPYHVLIAYHNLYCSGALILSKVVVTAASCFIRRRNHKIVVKVGSDTVTGLGQVIEAVDVKQHEYFGHSSKMDNDIAILILKDHVAFDSNVQKIPLMEFGKGLPAGTVIDVSGYADQKLPKYANSLLRSAMTILSNEECMRTYPGLITRSNYCAKYIAERGLRDNGGPAVFKDCLVGVLSYGATSEEEPFVTVLTNTSYFHKWIALNAKRFMLKYCADPVMVIHDYDLSNDEYRVGIDDE